MFSNIKSQLFLFMVQIRVTLHFRGKFSHESVHFFLWEESGSLLDTHLLLSCSDPLTELE